MKKRVMSFVLMLSLLFSVCVSTVYAYPGEGGLVDKGEVVLLIDNANAVVKGQKVEIEKGNAELVPFDQNGSAFIPLLFVCNSFGATTNWDSQTNTATITNGATQTVVTVGSKTMDMGGTSTNMVAPAQMVGSVLFVSLGDTAKILNKQTLYENGFIYLSDKEITTSFEKEDLLTDILSGYFAGGEPNGKGLPEGGTMDGEGASTGVNMNTITNKYLGVPYANLSSAQNMDIYLPETGDGPFPVIVAIHGGAFAGGNARGGIITNTLQGVDRGYAVVSINYRLSGEAKFPAAINDAKAAIRFVKANAAQYNFDANKIAVWGESAGANLAAMVGTSADDTTIVNDVLDNMEFSSSVQAVVDWFGPLDFLAMDEQFAQSDVTPKNPPTNTEGSPESRYIGQLITIDSALTKQADAGSYIETLSKDTAPYFFIQHGLADGNVTYQQSEDFAALLKEAIGDDKVTLELIPGAGHGTAEFRSQFNVDKVFEFLDGAIGVNSALNTGNEVSTPQQNANPGNAMWFWIGGIALFIIIGGSVLVLIKNKKQESEM